MWLRLQPRKIHDRERLVAGSVHHGFRGSHGCRNLMGSSLDFTAPLRLLRLFAANGVVPEPDQPRRGTKGHESGGGP